jgi:predicted Ser/Thr protein kinase
VKREIAVQIRKSAYLLAFTRGLLGEEAPPEGEDLRPFVRRGVLDLDTLALLEREAEILVTGRYPEFGDQQTAMAGVPAVEQVPPGGLFPWQDWSRYRPEAYLGEGGMGWVFRARDLKLQRAVALKFFRSGLPEASQVFLREARSQARIDHPHVAKVYEAGEQEGVSFLSMQYIHGPTLHKAASTLDLRDRVQVVRQAALGVHAAHRLGIVHRDLKPGNIMLEWDAEGAVHAYVMDFGLARDLSDMPTGLSRVMGTPSYMSPEQVEGPSVLIGPHTDVFALGVTLYELLAERLPFESPSAAEMMRRIVHEDPAPLRRLKPGLPRELEAVVQRCLEKDVLRRYDSAQDLADELQRFLDGQPVLASPTGPLERTLRRVRRNPLPYASGAAVVLLASGWLGYALLTGSRERALDRQVQEREAALTRLQGEMEALKARQDSERARSEALARQVAEAPTASARRELEDQLKASQARERELTQQYEAALRRSQALVPVRPQGPPAGAPGPETRPDPVPAAPRPRPDPAPAAPKSPPDTEEGPLLPPQLLREASAQYPARALSNPQNPYRNRPVSVLLRVYLDAAGHPTEVAVLQGVGGPWGYNESATAAVRASTYQPAQKDGRPVPGVLDVRVNFTHTPGP